MSTVYIQASPEVAQAAEDPDESNESTGCAIGKTRPEAAQSTVQICHEGFCCSV